VEATTSPPAAEPSQSFLSRHQFLIYRLFSLAGLVPIGAYLFVHLITNATVLNGVAAYQSSVDRIHSLGFILPAVEWIFIFIPILFHAVIGGLIISGAVPNTSSYPYGHNIRYVLQRATGMVAFVFILYHVLEMHHLGYYLGGGQFDPEHATSSAATAIDRSVWEQAGYAIGILACVYHLANGLWTWGITWGIWTTPAAQRRASYFSLAFGLFLGFVGLSALWGVATVNVKHARDIEDRMQVIKEVNEGHALDLLIDENGDVEMEVEPENPADMDQPETN
jgi:succinate dehydrogenase cytochrome b subunit